MTEKQVLIERVMPAIASVKRTEEGDGKDLYLVGTAIQGDVRNANGRIYPAEEIKKAVQQINRKIDQYGPIIGECDHPEGLNINLDRASHLIMNMDISGADGLAKFKVVPYGLGALVDGFVRHGAVVGVSSRGSGNVDRDGRVSDFDIVTIDIVANPSAPDAYPSPIYESLQRTRQGKETLKLADEIRHDPKAQRFFERELLTFISNMNPRKR